MSRRLTANADVDPHDLAGRGHSVPPLGARSRSS